MSSSSISTAIQSQANLVKIINKYVALQEGRRMLKGPCPFHTDHSDSFMVSPSKNIFKCFGCGQEGGPIEFIMAIEKKTYPEAVNSLAKEFGFNTSI